MNNELCLKFQDILFYLLSYAVDPYLAFIFKQRDLNEMFIVQTWFLFFGPPLSTLRKKISTSSYIDISPLPTSTPPLMFQVYEEFWSIKAVGEVLDFLGAGMALESLT